VDSSGSELSPIVGFCDCGDALSDFMKGDNFLISWATTKFSSDTLHHGASCLELLQLNDVR
jgi:hypothetical protein